MAKIGEILNRNKGSGFGISHKLLVSNLSSLSGHLDMADLVVEYDSRRMVFGLDTPIEREQIRMTGFGMLLPVTRQQEYKAAQVMSYEPALKLLAELYDKVALSISSLASEKNVNTVIAVGMLAAAGLCDVSPEAVRLSVAGKEFVEFLVGDESLAPIKD